MLDGESQHETRCATDARGRKTRFLVDADGGVDLSASSPIRLTSSRRRGLDGLRAIDMTKLPLVAARAPGRSAAVDRMRQFICVGLNYADHAARPARPPARADRLPQELSSPCGCNDDVVAQGSVKTDWEVGARHRHRHARAT